MFHLLKLAHTVVKTREDIYAEFYSHINMSSQELESWLKFNTSKAPEEGSELEFKEDKKVSRKIVKILQKKKYMLTKGDYACMEKASQEIQNFYQQKSQGIIPQPDWEIALKNIGHDPAKKVDK